MKTSGVSCETKFGLLGFLGHPTEDHPLDPNGDNYIGGVSESTVSDSLWRVQAKIPWDFLPPDVIRIQVK